MHARVGEGYVNLVSGNLVLIPKYRYNMAHTLFIISCPFKTVNPLLSPPPKAPSL